MDDRIDGLVLMFQDITPRRDAELTVKRSEERLRFLIDSATDYAIFTMTETGAIDSWNTGAERMFGYRSDQIIGRSFDVLFTPRIAPAASRRRRSPKRGATVARSTSAITSGAMAACSTRVASPPVLATARSASPRSPAT